MIHTEAPFMIHRKVASVMMHREELVSICREEITIMCTSHPVMRCRVGLPMMHPRVHHMMYNPEVLLGSSTGRSLQRAMCPMHPQPRRLALAVLMMHALEVETWFGNRLKTSQWAVGLFNILGDRIEICVGSCMEI